MAIDWGISHGKPWSIFFFHHKWMNKMLEGSHAKWHFMCVREYGYTLPQLKIHPAMGSVCVSLSRDVVVDSMNCVVTSLIFVLLNPPFLTISAGKSSIFRLAAFEDAVEHAVTELLATLQSCDFSRLTRSVLNATRALWGDGLLSFFPRWGVIYQNRVIILASCLNYMLKSTHVRYNDPGWLNIFFGWKQWIIVEKCYIVILILVNGYPRS